MLWIVLGIIAAFLIGVGVWQADRFGQGKTGQPGRHADTGEFQTVMNVTQKDYADYRTVKIPVIEGEVVTEIKALPPVPLLAPRTNTVLMESVDPQHYPEWVKDELENMP